MSSDVVARSPLQEAVAEEIRSLLARRRVSASLLARRMGVTQPYLWRRMSCEINFSVADLERIASALDVPVLQLLPARERAATVTVPYVPPAGPALGFRPMSPRPDGRPAGRAGTSGPGRTSRIRNAIAA